MKKNNKTYVLLIVVLGIWGFIGYRIVNTINPPEAKMQREIAQADFKPKVLKEREVFNLSLDYRDPFLGTVKTPQKNEKTVIKKVIVPVEPERAIAYTGFISDQTTTPNVFFVTIDGQQHMMNLNETVEDIKLIKGSKSEIKLLVKGKTKKIPLTE